MASAVFTAINPAGAGAATFADGATLAYQSGCQVCAKFSPGNIEREIPSIFTGGVNGGGTKDYGYRGQDLHFEVIYVGSSENALIAQWQADIAVISSVCTVVAAGQTYNACINQHGTKAEQPKSTGYGTYRMEATIHVRATRP